MQKLLIVEAELPGYEKGRFGNEYSTHKIEQIFSICKNGCYASGLHNGVEGLEESGRFDLRARDYIAGDGKVGQFSEERLLVGGFR